MRAHRPFFSVLVEHFADGGGAGYAQDFEGGGVVGELRVLGDEAGIAIIIEVAVRFAHRLVDGQVAQQPFFQVQDLGFEALDVVGELPNLVYVAHDVVFDALTIQQFFVNGNDGGGEQIGQGPGVGLTNDRTLCYSFV